MYQRGLIMKKLKYISPILVFLIIAFSISFYYFKTETTPSFYLATDKTFGKNEKPYVNLEGMANKEYEFRVYKINNTKKFLINMVKERHVREINNNAFGNAITLFQTTLHKWKFSFRKIARKEFNSYTRSFIKEALGVNFQSSAPKKQLAVLGHLKKHRLLVSFSIPKGGYNWSYRRIPIPVKDSGIYLIEGVSGNNLAYTLVVKSNLNFVTKQSNKESLIYVAASDTGEPVRRARVTIINRETARVTYSGKTSWRGLTLYRGKSNTKNLIIVNKGKEYAVSDPNFYSRSFYGAGGVRVFLYTDRPIYKPGDTVSFKGIVRKFRRDRYRTTRGRATYDVLDSRGSIIIKNKKTRISGKYATCYGKFTIPKKRNMRMGVYNLVLKYRNKTYSTEFSVETYKKPPFLVTVKAGKKSYVGSENIPITISAKYYYGNPVSNVKVSYRVFRKKKYTASFVGRLPFFISASEYLGKSNVNTAKDLILDSSGKLDDNGLYTFTIKPKKVDSDYTYIVIATVTGSSATLSGSTAISVNRSSFYVKLIKNSTVYGPYERVTITAKLIPFDTTLSPSQRRRVVAHRKIYAELLTRTFSHISRESYRKRIKKIRVKTNSFGVATLRFKIKKAGHYIVSVSATDIQGKTTNTGTTLWVSSKSDSIQVPYKNIVLKPSKDIYQVGDKAEVLIVTPAADGHVFVTMEGNRIFKRDVIKMKGNTYKYRVRIRKGWSPNFTFSVCQFSGNEIYKSNIKIVAPPIHKFLQVKLQPGRKTYRPGDTAVVTICTLNHRKRGVPAEVSLAVVDESVYQLQPDKNPPLSTYFYHPRRNNVSTTLSKAYRFFGYAEAKRLRLALNKKQNPSLTSNKDSQKARKSFKDTCFWKATVRTNRKGYAKVYFKLADNLTTWRVSARAVTADTKVGEAKTTFISRKKLILLGGIPRYMIKGHEQKVSANVTNMTKKTLQTRVSIAAKNAKVIGRRSVTVTLKPRKSEQVYFTVKTKKSQSGKACNIKLRATSGKLYDLVSHQVPMQHFGMYRLIAKSVHVERREHIQLITPKEYEDAKLEVRVNPGSGIALRQALKYLVAYPYGCIEQTMSKFVPLLAAKRTGYISPLIEKHMNKMIDFGLDRIKNFQHYSGGFGWFSNKKSDPLMTAYVYRSLAICKKLGIKFNTYMMRRAQRFLYRSLDRYPNDPFKRAYILFCLSEGSRVPSSMVNKISKTFDKQTLYGKALISLIQYNNGMKSKATESFNLAYRNSKYSSHSHLHFAKLNTTWSKDEVETAAALLTITSRMGRGTTMASKFIKTLLLNRRGIAWKNSRDTAMALLALSEYLKRYRESFNSVRLHIAVNGRRMKQLSITSSDLNHKNLIFPLSVRRLKSGQNKIRITKASGEPVFVTALISLYDKSGTYKAESRGMSTKREYKKMVGEKTSTTMTFTPTAADFVNVGDLVLVNVEVKARESKSYFMIEDPVPPGFSVVRKDTHYYSDVLPKEYVDKHIFNDRVVFFLTGPKRNFTIRYFLRANIPGTYKSLPAKSSLMYYPEIFGSSSINKISIR